MKTILVSNGRAVSFVSDEDYQTVSKYRWFLTGNGYAFRWLPRNKLPRRSVMMHRFILAAPVGVEVDHINGNKLDNRRSNIRFVSRGANQQRASSKEGKSKLRGVKKIRGRWFARIHVNNKEISLGGYPNAFEAAVAYNKAARLYYGKHAAGNTV